MTKLEELYNEYIDSEEYIFGKPIERVRDGNNEFYGVLNKYFKGVNKIYSEFEDANAKLVTAYEEQGFYAGFRYAMKLAKECF